jgi:hypothetical protein
MHRAASRSRNVGITSSAATLRDESRSCRTDTLIERPKRPRIEPTFPRAPRDFGRAPLSCDRVKGRLSEH